MTGGVGDGTSEVRLLLDFSGSALGGVCARDLLPINAAIARANTTAKEDENGEDVRPLLASLRSNAVSDGFVAVLGSYL